MACDHIVASDIELKCEKKDDQHTEVTSGETHLSNAKSKLQ